MSARHPQVRQREQRQHLRRVLRQAAVAHLRVAELALDHPERMLDLRAQARLVPLPALGVGFSRDTRKNAPQNSNNSFVVMT